MVKRAKEFAVCRLNTHTGELKYEYEDIKNIEEAETLSQYAMSYKFADEIVIIIPRSNIGIDKIPDYYNEAIALANKYRSEDSKPWMIGPANRLKSVLNALWTMCNLVRSGKEIEVCEKKRN